MYVQLHTRHNSAARGEVLDVRGQTAQHAAIPATVILGNFIGRSPRPNEPHGWSHWLSSSSVIAVIDLDLVSCLLRHRTLRGLMPEVIQR